MNSSYIMVNRFVLVLRNMPALAGTEVVAAYESDLKPYPIEKPIAAIALKTCKFSDKLPVVQPDGTQALSNSRTLETVFKITIYTPYEDGHTAPYGIADHIYTALLFQSTFDIFDTVFYDLNYVRDCHALVLETEFTMRQVVEET